MLLGRFRYWDFGPVISIGSIADSELGQHFYAGQSISSACSDVHLSKLKIAFDGLLKSSRSHHYSNSFVLLDSLVLIVAG